MYKIAISGKANSGKNTLSTILKEELQAILSKNGKGTKFKSIAFADPLKQMIELMFPLLPKKYLYGSSKFRSQPIPNAEKNGQPVTVRDLLIELGTNVGRNICETVWLDNFDYHYKKAEDAHIVIIPDVRFPNEYEHLKKLNFSTIRILRRDHAVINNISETSQDSIPDSNFDFIIHNDGQLKDLRAKVLEIIPNLTP